MMKNKEVIDHIVKWLNDYSDKSRTNGFVIGISGGIDSALTSTLCAETGKSVICLNMPIHQHKEEYDRGHEHINWLKQKFPNVTSHEVDLTNTFDNISASFPHDICDWLTMANTRSRLRMAVVRDRDAVRRTPRTLRAGGAVAFLTDQAGLNLASTFVPFFGRPAKTPRGPAVFALRLDAPVVFGTALRLPTGRYRLSFEEIAVPESGDVDRDVDELVARYTRTLEKWVRRAPEQYFWQHRRWKRQPEGTPEELRDPVEASRE